MPQDFLPPETATPVLRHLLATLAYRAAKVLRETPAGFGSSSFGDATRRPVLIVAHLADLMAWGVTLVQNDVVWKAGGGDDWDVEVRRFFENLEALDRQLSAATLVPGAAAKLIQGPLADALTHVGQLAMLRGMAEDNSWEQSARAYEALYEVYGVDHTNLDERLIFTTPLDTARIWNND